MSNEQGRKEWFIGWFAHWLDVRFGHADYLRLDKAHKVRAFESAAAEMAEMVSVEPLSRITDLERALLENAEALALREELHRAAMMRGMFGEQPRSATFERAGTDLARVMGRMEAAEKQSRALLRERKAGEREAKS